MGPIPAGPTLPLASQERGAQWRPLGNPRNTFQVESRPEGTDAVPALVDELKAAVQDLRLEVRA
ncbi:hypothetical protein ACIPSA_12610 [Streptomyces sp. NPDC086549]|uniref:hypothetical protein n=1 Tax=Streptomyces sp. NPDC086549 TaxID=3365752 RepID=UPI003819CC7A